MSQTFLGLNLILNIGALFGVSCWLESRDPFIFTFMYYFYWITLCISLILGFLSLLFYFEEENLFSKKELQIVSFILSFLWMGSCIGLTFLLRECLNLEKNNQCSGELISIIFSYPLAFIWFFIFSLNTWKL